MDEPVMDLELGRYALRSFKWSVEKVDPTLGKYLESPPLLPLEPKKPGPAYPGHFPPPKQRGMVRHMVEYVPPPLAERLGWWSDGAVRVWRAPTYAQPGDWEDGTCRAKCHAMTPGFPHDAPQEDCTCGIYGSLSYADLIAQFHGQANAIVAVIAAEGTTIIGDRGLRTAFARVVAYWVNPDDPLYRDVAARQFQDAKVFGGPLDMVEAYGLRLLPPPTEKLKRGLGGPEWWTRTHD